MGLELISGAHRQGSYPQRQGVGQLTARPGCHFFSGLVRWKWSPDSITAFPSIRSVRFQTLMKNTESSCRSDQHQTTLLQHKTLNTITFSSKVLKWLKTFPRFQPRRGVGTVGASRFQSSQSSQTSTTTSPAQRCASRHHHVPSPYRRCPVDTSPLPCSLHSVLSTQPTKLMRAAP